MRRHKALRRIVIDHLGHLDRIRGAEIGVWHGILSRSLLKQDQIELLMVDPYALWSVRRRLRRRNEAIAIARKNTEFAEDRRRMMIMSSQQAAEIVPDNWLDFVFIDADHRYENVLQDIQLWTPKIKTAGLVIGHDYDNPKYPGVRRAVEDYFPNHTVSNSLWLHKR
jgi:hypothetical protein